MNKLKHIIKRIVYFIKHGRDDYGREGFCVLKYKGTTVVPGEYVPHDELWKIDGEKVTITKIKI